MYVYICKVVWYNEDKLIAESTKKEKMPLFIFAVIHFL